MLFTKIRKSTFLDTETKISIYIIQDELLFSFPELLNSIKSNMGKQFYN